MPDKRKGKSKGESPVALEVVRVIGRKRKVGDRWMYEVHVCVHDGCMTITAPDPMKCMALLLGTLGSVDLPRGAGSETVSDKGAKRG